MHIVLNVVRAYIIHDKLNVLDVEASRTNTRRNKNILPSFLEVLNRELTICLIHASVQNEALITDIQKLFE